MSTGEGDNPRNGPSRPESDNRRSEQRIGVGGGDDSVSRIQLAARWAEAYATEGDSLGGMLRRFRAAYDYLDAVIHGVEPPDLDSKADEPQAVPATAPASQWAPPPTAPSPAPPAPPPWASPTPQEPGAPPAEPRPWG
jgi:hypothetical protein